jgi:hypothetical protein
MFPVRVPVTVTFTQVHRDLACAGPVSLADLAGEGT